MRALEALQRCASGPGRRGTSSALRIGVDEATCLPPVLHGALRRRQEGAIQRTSELVLGQLAASRDDETFSLGTASRLCAGEGRVTPVGPLETVSAWFESFDRGDYDTARSLFAEDAVVHVFGTEEAVTLRGFDAFVAWFRARRESFGESFHYRVDELLASDKYCVALITLSHGGVRRSKWRQVAVYRVEGGRITEARAYEEPGAQGGWADMWD